MLAEKNVGFKDGGKTYSIQKVSGKITPCLEMDSNTNITTSVKGLRHSKDGFYQRNSYPKNVINTKGGI